MMRTRAELLDLLSLAERGGLFNLTYDANNDLTCPVCGGKERDGRGGPQHKEYCVYDAILSELHRHMNGEAATPEKDKKYQVVVHFFGGSPPAIFASALSRQEAVDLRLALCRRENVSAVIIEDQDT